MGTDMTEIIQTAFQILCNVFVVLNTILVLKFVYGRDMRCDAKTLAVTGVTFLLADVLLTLIVPEEYRWVAEISIYVFLFSAVLFMARSRRVVTLILVIPAILFYIQTIGLTITAHLVLSCSELIIRGSYSLIHVSSNDFIGTYTECISITNGCIGVICQHFITKQN